MKYVSRNLLMLAMFLFPCLLFANEGKTGLTEGFSKEVLVQFKYMVYVFSVALAAIFGTISQSKTASSAIEGIARNPSAQDKIFIPMILSLALIESLVIITFVSIFLTK